jgi:Ni/Co efflux regulator RcnB
MPVIIRTISGKNHMRRMLISAAAMALLAAPALISSAWAQHDDSHRGGRDNAAPQAQGHPQQGQPEQGGGHDRGGNRGAAQAPAASAPAAQNRGDRGNGQGHRGAAPPQAAPQNQGNRDRNNGQSRGNSQGQRGQNNGNNNFNNRQGAASFGNRPGSNAGQRHDYSSFRDFHRDFNASRRFHAPAYRRPTGWYDHRWSFGEFLPRTYWVRNYWLDDFAAYGLPPPPYGAVWVRVGSDALLVDEDSGEVITVEYSVFY